MSKRNLVLFATTTLWLLMVGVGLATLWGYAVSPGAPGSPPSEWPTRSVLDLRRDRFTVVVVVHPHCACSRATLAELAALVARANDRVTAYVLFVRLAGFGDDWVETDLWRSAAAIPGVIAVRDSLGVEALRFGAATSGQTMLYSPSGQLLFSGGITAARGHYGDNAGLTAVVERIESGAGDRSGTSVFGCPLFDRGS